MPSLWMIFASLMFSIMGVCVKLASDLYSTSEIVMYRGVVGIVLLHVMIRCQGGSFKTSMPKEHLWRGAVGVLSIWLWFHALAALPLATTMTLNYMAPIWIALILLCGAWWHAKNQVQWQLVAAIALSFIGLVILLQPAFQSRQLARAVMALVSGMLSALAYLQVRKLGLMGEPEYRVVFYFSVINMLAGALGNLAGAGTAPGAWHAHTGRGVALLLGMGLCATSAQMAMTRAYRVGKTLVMANLQYTGIIFSSAFGVLIFGDVFDWHGWCGIAIIIGSSLGATFYNYRNTLAMTAAIDADAPAGAHP